MLRACDQLAARREVRAFVSFNPLPYGLIGARAAARAGKPWHLGFIGTDWNEHMSGRGAPLLRPLVSQASVLTATGESMRREMIRSGLDGDRIAILPNAIDLHAYPVADVEAADYDFLFVGRLVAEKRVDRMLRALARVRGAHPTARLLVVGDGAARSALEALRDQLGLRQAVDFVGHQVHTATWYPRARAVVIASDLEGMPFALVEGLACGLVPIATEVGSIGDVFTSGQNSLLFRPGDDLRLAAHMRLLLEEPARAAALRQGALRLRPGLGLDAATAVWDPWIRQLASGT